MLTNDIVSSEQPDPGSHKRCFPVKNGSINEGVQIHLNGENLLFISPPKEVEIFPTLNKVLLHTAFHYHPPIRLI